MSIYLSLEIVKRAQDSINIHVVSPPTHLLIFFCLPLISILPSTFFSCPKELSPSFNLGGRGIFHCKCCWPASVSVNYVSEALILHDFQSSIHATVEGSAFGTFSILESNMESITMFMRPLLPPLSFSMCVSSPFWCERSEKRR